MHLFASFIMRALMALIRDWIFVDGIGLAAQVVYVDGKSAFIKQRNVGMSARHPPGSGHRGPGRIPLKSKRSVSDVALQGHHQHLAVLHRRELLVDTDGGTLSA